MVNPESEAKSGATDPISATLKLKSGLAYLQNSEPLRLFFGPDALRDTNIAVDDADEFYKNVLGPGSKNRTKMDAIINIGGHGAISIIAAAKLRQDANVECMLVAKVLKGAQHEIVQSFINDSIQAKEAAPINTDYVVYDSGAAGKTNLVFEVRQPKSHTSIGIVGGQPKLRLADFDAGEREALLDGMSKADVVGMLSLKSDMTKDVITAMNEKGLSFREFVSDVTTGDDTAVLTSALEFLVWQKDKPAKITYLSINEEETLRYARLAYAKQNNNAEVERFLGSEDYQKAKKEREEAEAELARLEKQAGVLPSELRKHKVTIEEREATIKKLSTQFEEGLATGKYAEWQKNPAEAARYLNEYAGIALLYHTEFGAKVFDSTGKRETPFVPSVHLKSVAATLGAGDTMLGGFMVPLGLMRRQEREGVPEEQRITPADCLMVAIAGTDFRLQNEMVAGTLDDCYELVSRKGTKTTAFRPTSDKKVEMDEAVYSQLPEAKSAAAVQRRLEILQAALADHSTDAERMKAQEVVGDFVFKRYSFEERLRKLSPEQAVHMMLDAIEGPDAVLASAAIDSMRRMARQEPKIKEIIRKELGINQQTVAILNDLDGNLFDSTSARERAGAKAIQKGLGLKLDGKELDLDSSRKLYIAVYNAYKHFREIGYSDFRQVWNIEQFYAAAAALVEIGGPNGVPPKNKEELSKLLNNLEKGFSDPNFRNRLSNRVNSLLNEPTYKEKFKAAMNKFEEVGLKPFPDTLRTLSALQGLLDAKLYVVTEGDDPTQLNKVKMLGLSNFFANGKRVLSTSFVGQDWRVASDLNYEETRIGDQLQKAEREQAKASKQLLKLLEAPQPQGGRESEDAKAATDAYRDRLARAEEEIQRLNEQKGLLEWTKGMLKRRAQSGEGGSFYDVVLRAINLNPDDIRQGASLGAGGLGEWNDSNQFIAIRIGDNALMDIAPVNRVAPEALTCLLKRGRYRENFEKIQMNAKKLGGALEELRKNPNDEAAKQDRIASEKELRELMAVKMEGPQLLEFAQSTQPAIEAESLSDILRSLLRRETYKEVKPVSKPRLVAENPVEEDLNMLMAGALSDSKVVSVVRERLFSDISLNPAAMEIALAHFIQHLDNKHLEEYHLDRMKNDDMKIAAADSIASLLSSSTQLGGAASAKMHADASNALGAIFTNIMEDPKVRAEALMAFDRIGGNHSWLEMMPERDQLEMDKALRKVYTAVRRNRQVQPINDNEEKIRLIFQMNKASKASDRHVLAVELNRLRKTRWKA